MSVRGNAQRIALLVLVAGGGCAHQVGPTGRWVNSLTIQGNRAFSDRDLRSVLATEKTGWWPLAGHKPFDPAALDLDLKRVPAYYADRGWFDARVKDHTVRERDDGGVDITIVVEEGEPSRIRSVVIEGFPDEALARNVQKMARSFGLTEGKVVDYGRYNEARERAETLLKEAGHAYGKLQAEIAVDRDERSAVITFRAEPGPDVKLGKVQFVGAEEVPRGKLQNRVTWDEGDPYHPIDLSTTQGRLYDLGFFSSVRIELPPQPAERADVQIHLTPGKLHELKLGGGFGVERQREEVRLRGEWTFSNFLGGLRKLRLRLRPAYAVVPSITNAERHGPTLDTSAQLTQPDLFDSPVVLNALAGYDLLLTEGYQAHGPRAQVGLNSPLGGQRLLVGASWNLQYLDFFAVNRDVFDPTSTSLGFGFKDPYRLGFYEQTAQIDLRDRSLDPRYGGFVSLRLEEGTKWGAGDFSYFKVTPELRVYVPLHRRVVVAGRGMLGWLRPAGGNESDSPVTRRYQLGGPSSHRGFSFGRLSPQIVDSQGELIPVGGDGALLFSAEARVDVLKLGGSWLGVVPFFDAGDVTADFDDLSLKRLHHAAGVSIEYETPVGIVRAGGAFRLNRLGGAVTPGLQVDNPDPGQRFAFHITLGEAF